MSVNCILGDFAKWGAAIGITDLYVKIDLQGHIYNCYIVFNIAGLYLPLPKERGYVFKNFLMLYNSWRIA